MTIEKKEARSEVLYASVTKKNKAFAKTYKTYGFSTLSSFINHILEVTRKKEEAKNGRKINLRD